jgi:hypothetical protein
MKSGLLCVHGGVKKQVLDSVLILVIFMKAMDPTKRDWSVVMSDVPKWLRNLIMSRIQTIDTKFTESYKEGLLDAYWDVLTMHDIKLEFPDKPVNLTKDAEFDRSLIRLDLRTNFTVGSRFLSHLRGPVIPIWVETQEQVDEILNTQDDFNQFITIDKPGEIQELPKEAAEAVKQHMAEIDYKVATILQKS